MDNLPEIRERGTPMICLTPNNCVPRLMGIPPLLFPAEYWQAVLNAAFGEGWKPEHPIAEYCIDDSSESANELLTHSWDFAAALKCAANRIPDDFDHFAPNEEFHLACFIECDKSILTNLINFARRSGGFAISWPTAEVTA